jgi:hypothetical protein
MPVGAALAAEGPEAAAKQYHFLQDTQQDHYDADPWRFMDAIWGAIEVRRPAAVMPLLQLWVTLQPDAALAYETLGWVYMIQDEQELAVDHLRRTLVLDPEAWHAKRLLEQLSRDEGNPSPQP